MKHRLLLAALGPERLAGGHRPMFRDGFAKALAADTDFAQLVRAVAWSGAR